MLCSSVEGFPHLTLNFNDSSTLLSVIDFLHLGFSSV